MKYNNLIIAATLEAQKTIDMREFTFDIFTAIRFTEFISANETHNLKSWVRILAKSHVLVTVGDWAENTNLVILVDIARKLNIPVVPQSNLKKYVSEKND